MAVFDLYRDYPLTQILDESVGSWIVPGLIKGLSPSEAVILLHPSKKEKFEVVFPSSDVCLVHFYLDQTLSEREIVDSRLRDITSLWVFVESNEVVTAIRVLSRPFSFILGWESRSTLTIPMDPSLSTDEWHRLGMRYVSVVTINEDDRRHIGTQEDVEELCQDLRRLPSFWLHASRFEGDELDLGADANGATVFYLDIRQAVKMVSMNSHRVGKEFVRMKIAALPDLELEVERQHLIPLEKGLGMLRSFLNAEIPIGMAPWPVDG